MEAVETLHALVVDDDAVTNYLTRCLLLKAGRFGVPTVFTDALLALTFLEKQVREIAVNLPHLLLLNINMPNLDSFDFLSGVRESCPELLEQYLVGMLSTSTPATGSA